MCSVRLWACVRVWVWVWEGDEVKEGEGLEGPKCAGAGKWKPPTPSSSRRQSSNTLQLLALMLCCYAVYGMLLLIMGAAVCGSEIGPKVTTDSCYNLIVIPGMWLI
mmetsp:Transcript_7180/g.15679  ORF Transcript_7180/g.15679 Transcript_7180/m.15679 type:complete len:106 (-) Transcript_7180:127-444(-)